MEGSGEDAGAVGCGWCDCVYSDVDFDGVDGMDRTDLRVMARVNRLERARVKVCPTCDYEVEDLGFCTFCGEVWARC